jgi:hypothetical protein
MIRSFVDMCFSVSLDKASITPTPDDPWLESLSAATLDFWKVGEVFLGKQYEKIVICDPAEIKTAPGSSASDSGYLFEFPDHWLKTQKTSRYGPQFILNTPDPYALRGMPQAYDQLLMLVKQITSGRPQLLTPASFGFRDAKANEAVATELTRKILNFRRKLGKSLNTLWPDMNIELFVINTYDVLQACKKFGFIK